MDPQFFNVSSIPAGIEPNRPSTLLTCQGADPSYPGNELNPRENRIQEQHKESATRKTCLSGDSSFGKMFPTGIGTNYQEMKYNTTIMHMTIAM